jgi:hypothetical protein
MLDQKSYDTETDGGDSKKREGDEKVRGGGQEKDEARNVRRQPEEQTPSGSRVYEKENSHITITHRPLTLTLISAALLKARRKKEKLSNIHCPSNSSCYDHSTRQQGKRKRELSSTGSRRTLLGRTQLQECATSQRCENTLFPVKCKP